MLRAQRGTGSRTLWTSLDFVGLAGASLVVGLGYQVYSLDFPLLVNTLSHRSPVAIGALQGVEFLPNLFLAMLIGVVVDRVSRRRFILTATALRAAVLLGIYALLRAGVFSMGAILASAFLLSTVSYAFHNARMSIVKVVFARERLIEVNAVLSFLEQVVAIAGPAAAGLLLTWLPLQAGLAVITATALLGLLLLRLMHFRDDPAPAQRSFGEDFKAGVAELRRNRPLFALSLIVVFTNSTGGSFSAMLLYFAKDGLHVGNGELGLLLTAMSIGAALGSAAAPRLRAALGIARLFAVAIAGSAAAYLLMFLAHDTSATVLSLLLEGTSTAVLAVGVWTFRQETTPPEMIGRISGLTGSIFKLGMPFAIFASGFLAAALGARAVFLGCAAVNLLLVLYFLRSPLRTVERRAARVDAQPT